MADTPLGRQASVDDVAALIAFLATEEAGYLTGTTQNINGGVLHRLTESSISEGTPMTQTLHQDTRAGALARVRRTGSDITSSRWARFRVRDMSGRPSDSPTCWPWSTRTSLGCGQRTRSGRTATGSCCRWVTTPSRLYAALAEAGILDVAELETYGSDDSRLPMSGMASYTPGMEISGGSLGHGLGRRRRDGARTPSPGQGRAGDQPDLRRRAGRGLHLGGGDGAAHHRLGSLLCVVDMNGLQADGPTGGVLHIEPVEAKWASFGWRAVRSTATTSRPCSTPSTPSPARGRQTGRRRLRHPDRPRRAVPRDPGEVPLHPHRRARMGAGARSSAPRPDAEAEAE